MVPSRAFIVTRLYAFPVFERAGSRAALQRRRRRTNTAPRRPAGSVQKRRCRRQGWVGSGLGFARPNFEGANLAAQKQ
jgi:hypothetical protein